MQFRKAIRLCPGKEDPVFLFKIKKDAGRLGHVYCSSGELEAELAIAFY
jgi:hypothetical protein